MYGTPPVWAGDGNTHDWARELAPLGRRSLKAIIDVSNKCNLRCRMCHFSFDTVFHQPARHMRPETFTRIAAAVLPHAHTLVLSAGNEPLMSPWFIDILRIAATYKVPHTYFITNAQLLTEKVADALIACGVGQVQVSADGATKETYEYIRRGASFERLIRNLRYLTARKGELGSVLPSLQFNVVLMQRNLEELHRYVDLAEDVGADSIAARHLLCVAGLGMERESLAEDRGRANFHFRKFFERVSRSSSVAVSTFPDFFDEAPAEPDNPASPALDTAALPDVPCAAASSTERQEAGVKEAPIEIAPAVSAEPTPHSPPEMAPHVEGAAAITAEADVPSPPPFGSFDAPVEPHAFVGDEVVVAGWALDAVGIEEVAIERTPFASDLPSDLNCRGHVHLGCATFVDGAREDVASAYADYPAAARAGWWCALRRDLITSEPWIDVTVYAVARNVDGAWTELGQRVLSFNSAPFGSFDQPAELESNVNNAVQLEGWALDRTGVTKVTIEREPLPGEHALLNERGLVEIGSAKLLNGARPDAARAFPWCSGKSRAGWSFELRRAMISDNVPCDTTVWAVAQNAAGCSTRIGRRSISFAQGGSARPYIFCSRPFDSVMIDSVGAVTPYPDCRVLAPYGSMADETAQFDRIWFGKQFTELRQRIIDRDPPPMCLTCAHFINRNVDDGEYFKPR